MSRARQNDRPFKKRLSLRSSIVAEVDAALVDPLRGKPHYAEWSTLVELLLVEWLAGRIQLPLIPTQGKRLDDLLPKENPNESL